MQRIAYTWGSAPEERQLPYPCDGYMAEPDATYFRAVDIQAPASLLFRWLCQMKVAPYSYDWLDNGFCRSPVNLTPGVEQLEAGQCVMSIFRLTEFEQDRQLTLIMHRPGAIRIFGEIVITYMVNPRPEGACRLVVKMLVRYPRRGVWRLMRWLLPWGDLFMMRKQLLTFKALAERSAREGLIASE